MNNPNRLGIPGEASQRRSMTSTAVLALMFSAVAAVLQLLSPSPQLPTMSSPNARLIPPAAHAQHIAACSLLFCFGTYLISIILGAYEQGEASSRFHVFGIHCILLALASLLSITVPPTLWLAPYILFAISVVCYFFPLEWLRGRVKEEAINFFIRRFASSPTKAPAPPRVEIV